MSRMNDLIARRILFIWLRGIALIALPLAWVGVALGPSIAIYVLMSKLVGEGIVATVLSLLGLGIGVGSAIAVMDWFVDSPVEGWLLGSGPVHE